MNCQRTDLWSTLQLDMKYHFRQPQEVNKAKHNLYEPWVDYLKEQYKLDQIYVIGLMIEANGKITQIHEKFRHQFGLGSKLTDCYSFKHKWFSSVDSKWLVKSKIVTIKFKKVVIWNKKLYCVLINCKVD